MTDSFWDDAEVIHVYSREQAIADGVLVDAGDLAREAGFTVPVALTHAVHCIVAPNSAEQAEGQDYTGRLWDVLNLARVAARGARDGSEARFGCLFVLRRPAEYGGHRCRPGAPAFMVSLKMLIGPGDAGEPVVTIMLPDED